MNIALLRVGRFELWISSRKFSLVQFLGGYTTYQVYIEAVGIDAGIWPCFLFSAVRRSKSVSHVVSPAIGTVDKIFRTLVSSFCGSVTSPTSDS